MSLSSLSDLKVPKSLAFIALLGLLLIAAVAFAPNSSAGLPAFQNGGGSGSKRSRPEFVPGEALVRFKSDRAFEGSAYMPVPSEGAQQRFGEIQSMVGQEEILVQVDRFDGSDLVDGLRIAHAADTGKAIAALRARDDVEYAEPNYIVHAFTPPNDPCFPANSLAICQSTSLYGMTKIGAPQAWDITTGSSNVVVGIIDEGIDISHPDLASEHLDIIPSRDRSPNPTDITSLAICTDTTSSITAEPSRQSSTRRTSPARSAPSAITAWVLSVSTGTSI